MIFEEAFISFSVVLNVKGMNFRSRSAYFSVERRLFRFGIQKCFVFPCKHGLVHGELLTMIVEKESLPERTCHPESNGTPSIVKED